MVVCTVKLTGSKTKSHMGCVRAVVEVLLGDAASLRRLATLLGHVDDMRGRWRGPSWW